MPDKCSIYSKQYSLTQILDKSWEVYRNNFTKILYITLLVYIPINIILYFFPAEETFDSWSDFFKVVNFLETFVGILATMAIMLIVKHWIDKKEIEWLAALRQIMPIWPQAIWVQFLSGLFIILAFLALILPGIYLAVAFLFVIPALLFNQQQGMAAIKYSYALVKGCWWRTFGIALAIGILTFLATWLPDAIYLLVPPHIITDLVTMTAADVIYAYSIVAFTVMFLNYDSNYKPAPVKKPKKK